MSDTRKTAAKSLQKIIENKVFLSEIKEEFGEDKNFLNMLLLTSLRHMVYIKKIIKKFSNKKLPKKEAFAEYCIILAVCEILYLETPQYAVLNSYVDLIKKNNNKFIAGFANAVLRKVTANKDELITEDKGEFFPVEFINILKPNYDIKTIHEIEKAAIQEPPLDLTVKKDFHPNFGEKLFNGSIRIFDKSDIENLEGYKEGRFWVQDVAASLAAMTAGEISGKKVLDLCAAPGGKSAQLISKGADVTCLDISEQRMQRLKENLARLEMKAETITADGIEYLKNYNGEKFDLILLDAPCSATGTIRRHPEIVHIKGFEDIKKLGEIQKEFLKYAGNALKKDGILIYCICSISKYEGEKQINKFLKENNDFKLLQIKEKEINLYDNIPQDLITEEGYIRTLPCHLADKGGMDSFFIAKLQKVK